MDMGNDDDVVIFIEILHRENIVLLLRRNRLSFFSQSFRHVVNQWREA